jgi:hypothetical protein
MFGKKNDLHYSCIMTQEQSSTLPDLGIDESLKIMLDLCMDYGHLTKFVNLQEDHDLLFAICQFEESVCNAQKYLSSLDNTGTVAVNEYIKICGRDGYNSVEDLISLSTTLYDDSRCRNVR